MLLQSHYSLVADLITSRKFQLINSWHLCPLSSGFVAVCHLVMYAKPPAKSVACVSLFASVTNKIQLSIFRTILLVLL